MQIDDQYMDRTPDLVSRIRKLREAAEKEMDRFTCVADYDVRRVVGQRPKALSVSQETVSPSHRDDNISPPPTQTSIEFSPAAAERGDDGEAA